MAAGLDVRPRSLGRCRSPWSSSSVCSSLRRLVLRCRAGRHRSRGAHCRRRRRRRAVGTAAHTMGGVPEVIDARVRRKVRQVAESEMCGIWGSTVGEAGVEARLSKVSVAGCCSARTHHRAVVGGKVRPRGRIRRHESGGSERDLVGTMRSLLLRSPRRGLRAPLRSSAALPCNGYPRHPEVGMCGRRTIDGCRRSVAVGTSEAGLRCCEGRVENPSLEEKIEGSEGTERPDFSPFQIEPSKSSDVIPPPARPSVDCPGVP
jgi:hypothetical protein